MGRTRVGFTRGVVRELDQTPRGAVQGAGRDPVRNGWIGSRSPRRAECGSPCLPWGKACCCWGGGRLKVSLGTITCSPPTHAGCVSPFLAESNTHEAWLVGPVRFHSGALPAQPSALAPLRDRWREGSDLVASPKEGRSCARVLAPSGFTLGSLP